MPQPNPDLIPVQGFPHYYVAKNGMVWSDCYGGKYRKLNIRSDGRLQVDLWRGNKKYVRKVHHLVLEAFVGPRPEGMECRHIDGNCTNNHLDNLCWGTHSENQYDAVRHGTHPKTTLGKFGEKHHNSKFSNQDRHLIFNAYYDGAYTQRELANHFNVTQACIWHIIHNNRWRETLC